MDLRLSAIGRFGMALAFSSLTACGGSTDKTSDGSGGTQAGGCTSAPNCGSCVQCYDECICNGSSTDQCIAQCATASGGSGGGPSGGGGSGGTGSGGSTGSVQIQTGVRHIEAGEEAYFCQNFANPFGSPVDVVQSESFMTPGSHHMFVFYNDVNQDGALETCSGLEYSRTLHTAQTPQHLTKYPPGVGRFVDATSGLRVMAHYVNTSAQAVDAQVTVVFQVLPGGTSQMQAASLFFNNFEVYVPKNSTGSATKTCDIPHDAQLIDVVSHMHQFGTHFVAKTDKGAVLYEGTDWNEPEAAVFDPPVLLPAGTQVTYTCDYKNTTSQTLTFGDSALTNEMCILSGTYFPAPAGASIICF